VRTATFWMGVEKQRNRGGKPPPGNLGRKSKKTTGDDNQKGGGKLKKKEFCQTKVLGLERCIRGAAKNRQGRNEVRGKGSVISG